MSNDTSKQLVPWGPEKKLKWFLEQRVKRAYRDDVLSRLEKLRSPWVVEQYGNLTLDPERFPLYAVRLGNRKDLPTVLITGGVHGYETSGVKGALQFLEQHAASYSDFCNFVVAPCVSPWSYETINRLDPVMENPNRQFKPDSKAEECLFLMQYLERLGGEFSGHLDLHETTDSDRTFLPEEYAKNGLWLEAKDVQIDDGFYLIGSAGKVRTELETAMIETVRKLTHIAVPDERGMISDTKATAEGVIHMSGVPGLCAELTGAGSIWGAYTTEMYPDSPRFKGMTEAQIETLCAAVQVACVRGALDFWSRASR